VIVATLSDEAGQLTKLAGLIEAAATGLGFAPEQRSFRPHITLARLKRPSDVAAWLPRPPPESPAARFDRLVLYRSILSRQGPSYTVLAQTALP
jgi:2'-5' RNA ligase